MTSFPMPKHILGVDPGLSGGLAIVDLDGKLVKATRMPNTTRNRATVIDGSALAEFLDSAYLSFAVVEAVSSRPRQAGQFQFGINTGIIHGALYALGIPFELVAPARWKGAYGIKRQADESKADKKGEARELASHLWPDMAHHWRFIKDDGVAEAALMARYGMEIYKGAKK